MKFFQAYLFNLSRCLRSGRPSVLRRRVLWAGRRAARVHRSLVSGLLKKSNYLDMSGKDAGLSVRAMKMEVAYMTKIEAFGGDARRDPQGARLWVKAQFSPW